MRSRRTPRGATGRPRDAAFPRGARAIGSAASPSTSWCSPARSRGSTCSRAASSIPATRSSSIGPGYLGAIQTFRNAGARLVGWDITRADTDELEELLLRYRPKLIYTNPTHQNPTGITLSIRTRRELLELAARYRVPIVEDDTYRELALTAPPPPSLFTLDEAHTVVIRLNSFSKMLAPGCASAGSAPCGRSSISWR